MRAASTMAALVLVAAALYYAWPAPVDDSEEDDSTGPTAGDDDSNMFLDTVDTMTSTFNGGWPTSAAPYRATIEGAAAQYGVPVLLLAWLLWTESRYSAAIISGAKRSPAGAMGIAQFRPATAAQELGSEAAALDPAQAIPGAARMLAKLYRSTGSWTRTLAAYNWGIGNLTRKGLAAAPRETINYYTTILAKAGISEAA